VNALLTAALEIDLDVTVDVAEPIAGGCINEAWRVRLGDGALVFVKSHPQAPPHFFEVEARGLAWLADGAGEPPDAAGSLGVPRVLAWRDADPAYLAVEWIDAGDASEVTHDAFGRGLAHLHRAGAPSFGWEHEGYIGNLPQANQPCESWPEFYRHRRLEPLARAAVDQGWLPSSATADFTRLFDRLEELVGPPEPPARLHGDLWGGNRLVDRQGRSWLIDPAPYGGHREIDLAMMRLFGGFSATAFAAYDEVHRLADGHGDRVALYQLYPLLVHVTLFGASYAGQTLDALRTAVR
jgi:fructosamine-3-kinase